MKNIKVSKTFSTIIIIILLGVFVLPSLQSRYTLNKGLEYNDALYTRQTDHDESLLNSVDKLGLIDVGLKRCINAALFKYKGVSVTTTEVSNVFQLKRLDCFRNEIKSIQGIDQLTQLQSLDLSYNPWIDMSPLLKLGQLETLDLGQVSVADFNALHKLKNLKYLKLPNVETVLCSDVAKFISSQSYKIDGIDYAESTCLGNTDSVHIAQDIRHLQKRKEEGGNLSKREQKRLLIYEINKQQSEYNDRYRNQDD